jgi:protein required for attachment to host cells
MVSIASFSAATTAAPHGCSFGRSAELLAFDNENKAAHLRALAAACNLERNNNGSASLVCDLSKNRIAESAQENWVRSAKIEPSTHRAEHHAQHAGRPKGAKNVMTRALKDAIVRAAAETLGGRRGHFISSSAAIKRACAPSRATSAGSFELHSWSTSDRARNSSASPSIRMRSYPSHTLSASTLSYSACPAALRLPAPAL